MYVKPSHWFGRQWMTIADLPAYMYPNDSMESDRLDLQYGALKTLHDDKIYFAPLKDPRRILDIGTGTGIWPIEMGESC